VKSNNCYDIKVEHWYIVEYRSHANVGRVVKVTRPLNAITENQPYLQNGKAYKLQTWYMDGV